MHLPALKLNEDGDPFVPAPGEQNGPSPRGSRPLAPLEADKELLAIFERTYGPVKPRAFEPAPRPKRPVSSDTGPRRPIGLPPQGPEYLLVDGYNMIFAWEELNALSMSTPRRPRPPTRTSRRPATSLPRSTAGCW